MSTFRAESEISDSERKPSCFGNKLVELSEDLRTKINIKTFCIGAG